MAEQTKRQQLESHLAARAAADPEFRDRLLEDPKRAIEGEIGLRFPKGLSVSVHEEKLNELHVVLRVDLLTGGDLPGGTDGGERPPREPFWKRR
jgi:hypothetical protein